MGEKEVVSKKTSKVVAVVCFALVVALAGVCVYEMQLAGQLSDQVSNQEDIIAGLQSTVTQKNSEIAAKNQQVEA
ncbi:MAG: hypothetical protein NWF04_07835 [Candidatus Bathyarchaeota archaeon]|nr:hypothetical protein [Candidatus Bathyarchaeota archaeon]